MARLNIDILFKSRDTIEVRPGVMDYSWSLAKGIPATVVKSGINIQDNQTVNQDWTPSTQLSFIMSNDATDRLNRIGYIHYLGYLYEVQVVSITRPKVIVNIGNISNRSIDEYIKVSPMKEA